MQYVQRCQKDHGLIVEKYYMHWQREVTFFQDLVLREPTQPQELWITNQSLQAPVSELHERAWACSGRLGRRGV